MSTRTPATYLGDDGQIIYTPEDIIEEVSEYKTDIKEAVKTLVHSCPPEDCYIISPGRSLAIFYEYLDTIEKNYVLNIPLSSFSFNIDSEEIYDKRFHSEFEREVHPSFLPALSQEHKEKLYKHFDEFIDLDLIKNRKIILVDYAATGNTLFSLHGYLQDYLNTKNQKNAIGLFGITTKHGSSYIKRNATFFKLDVDLIVTNKSSWAQKILRNHKQKLYARFGTFNILKDSSFTKRADKWNPLPYMKELNMTGMESLKKTKLKSLEIARGFDALHSCNAIINKIATSPLIRTRQWIRSKGW